MEELTTDTVKTGSNLHDRHYYGFCARDASDMDYQPELEVLVCALPLITHMQKLSYQN